MPMDEGFFITAIGDWNAVIYERVLRHGIIDDIICRMASIGDFLLEEG
jgi:hypothetical protein